MIPRKFPVDSARRRAELATIQSGPRRAIRSALAANSANGTAIHLWTCNGKCLDAPDVSSADGMRLQIWDCLGGVNQVWRLPA
jgi:hypothetical protein